MTRILVVDDEPQLLRALGTNLRARGYDVELAATGEAALTVAARKHPDLVVLDLGLPGIDGTEVIRGLRGWTSVPIIVLSVRETETEKVAALDAGADDYVTKPFGMDELLARPACCAAPSGTRGGGGRRRDAGLHRRPRSQAGPEARRRSALDAHRVARRRDARPQRGQAGDAAATAARGLGPAVREGDELPARLPRADPSQARARPVAARATSSPRRAWATASSSTLSC